MNILEPYRVLPFPTDYYTLYKGIAFNGCFFYLTMPKKQCIYQYNTDFGQECVIEVSKPYNCICYDNTENCFWASVDKMSNFLYKLDTDLKEIDFIRINKCNRLFTKITGLSYNCETNSILVAFTDFIAEIKKNGDAKFMQSPCKGCYNAVLSIAPYYVVSIYSEKEQYVAIFTYEGNPIASFALSKLYRIEDIIFYPDKNNEKKKYTFYILATKHNCYPRLLQCQIDACGMELCCCNYEYSCQVFADKKNREQSSNDLIESIALVETALSHILNELGEKIQKTNQMADNICDMLEVNKAVNKTIMNITQLEHILYAKLETLNSINSQTCCKENINTKD